MNIVTITGRICADIELRQTQNGVSVATFTVAVSRPRVKDTTDFINCVAWRSSAEFLSRYTHKGDMIAIVGMLTTRKYEDKEGNKRVAYEVLCDRVESLQRRDDAQQGNYSSYAAKVARQNEFITELDEEDDDLPWED